MGGRWEASGAPPGGLCLVRCDLPPRTLLLVPNQTIYMCATTTNIRNRSITVYGSITDSVVSTRCCFFLCVRVTVVVAFL